MNENEILDFENEKKNIIFQNRAFRIFLWVTIFFIICYIFLIKTIQNPKTLFKTIQN